MTTRAADDFDTIRLRMSEISRDRMSAGKRCPHCDEALTNTHAAGCKFSGTVIESETMPIANGSI